MSLSVAVHNRNWAMRARVGAPLDTELLFASERFIGVRMRGSSHGNIRPWKTEVYNVAASGESAAPLGSIGVAEFLKESVAGGAFRLRLKLAGEVKYPLHSNAHRLEATCPLELPLSSPATFKKSNCFCCCSCDDRSCLSGLRPHSLHCLLILLLLLAAILDAAFAFVLLVRVAIEDSSLAHLALAGPNMQPMPWLASRPALLFAVAQWWSFGKAKLAVARPGL